jgi:hypothetical protein
MKHTAIKQKKTDANITDLSGVPSCAFPSIGSSGTVTEIIVRQDKQYFQETKLACSVYLFTILHNSEYDFTRFPSSLSTVCKLLVKKHCNKT